MKLNELTQHQKDNITDIVLSAYWMGGEAGGIWEVRKELLDQIEHTFSPEDERDLDFLANAMTQLDLIDNLEPADFLDKLVHQVWPTIDNMVKAGVQKHGQ